VLQADCDDVEEFVAMLREHHAGEIVVGTSVRWSGPTPVAGTIGIAFHVRE
jgi:hypothetical protein